MQTATSTPTSAKRVPAKAVTKPLSKAKVTAVPKPSSTGKGASRTLYKFIGKVPEAKGFTPQVKTRLESLDFMQKDLLTKATLQRYNLLSAQR